jgi:hypothetical protein
VVPYDDALANGGFYSILPAVNLPRHARLASIRPEISLGKILCDLSQLARLGILIHALVEYSCCPDMIMILLHLG